MIPADEPVSSCTVKREGEEFVVTWPGFGVLRSGMGFQAADGLQESARRKFACGPARAAERYFRHDMTLHGAAVGVEGKAFVFLGESGAGKSTAAALLCERAGATLLADDLAGVDFVEEAFFAAPSETEHWLDEAAQRMSGVRDGDLGPPPGGLTSKQAFPAARVAKSLLPLCTIVELVPFGSEEMRQPIRLRGHQAMRAVARALFQLPLDDSERRRLDLDWLSSLCQRVPVLRLSRPEGGEALLAELRLLSHDAQARPC